MFLQRIRENWRSGLTVTLVSIPLSVSLAVASQATPIDGIITAIWAGLVAAMFGGSHFNIVGPTGALSGLLATYAMAHGADALSSLAIVAGVMILLAYVLKLERYLVFVPASSLHGFTLGVAFIIAFNQFNFATGLHDLPKHEKFIQNLAESFRHLSEVNFMSLAIFLIFLSGLFLIWKLIPKLPPVILLTPLGGILGFLSSTGRIPFEIQTLEGRFGELIPVLRETTIFSFDTSLLVPALTVTLVAILETMLSAKIADGMTGTRHDKRKEMLGLGLANVTSGFMGGIPATAALARTALNIKSGANHRTSSIISVVGVVGISFLLLSSFKFVPLAVIAAILVYTAVRMIEVHHFFRMFRYDKTEFILTFLVAFVTVVEDPMVGILFGTAAALLIFVNRLSAGQYELSVNNAQKERVEHHFGKDKLYSKKGELDTLVYSVKGILAYMNGQAHVARFEEDLGACKHVILRLRELYFVDLDGLDALSEIVDQLEKGGRAVFITGVNPLVQALVCDSQVYKRLKKEGRVFAKTSEALVKLGFPLKS